MSTFLQPTIMVQNEVCDEQDGQRWLVQVHPLDLDQGPIKVSDTVTLGRDKGCELHLPDSSVSRRHAEIVKTDSGFQINDLGSTNGVIVNEQRMDSCELKTGDRIQLGGRIFRFLADNDLEAQYHETVYSMMTRDGLTGTFNKRYLIESLDREVARCRRYKRPLSVVLMDIDHFKMVNDTHGHLVGDEVLQELSFRLSKMLRDDEILARFGGEEFAIVIVESSRENAIAIAERCRKVIAETPFKTAAGPLEITISLGVSSPEIEQIEDRVKILADADERLYEAKKAGRNQVKA